MAELKEFLQCMDERRSEWMDGVLWREDWCFHSNADDIKTFELMGEVVGCTQQHPHRTASNRLRELRLACARDFYVLFPCYGGHGAFHRII